MPPSHRKLARSARTNAVRSARLPRSIAESQGAVSLGYRQITIESLEILKTIERSGEQRVEAAAWPFLLSLPAGASDGDRANDVPWTRCRSATCCDSSRHPGRSIRIQFQQLFATRFQIKLHLQQWARASAAPRAPREQLVH
jgi:hypothetical protein